MNNIDNFIQIFSSGNSDVSVHTLGISVIKSNYYYYPENYLSNIITKNSLVLYQKGLDTINN